MVVALINQSSSVDFPEELKERKQLKELEIGIDLFNRKPRKGIQFLLERGMVGKSNEDVAMWTIG